MDCGGLSGFGSPGVSAPGLVRGQPEGLRPGRYFGEQSRLGGRLGTLLLLAALATLGLVLCGITLLA